MQIPIVFFCVSYLSDTYAAYMSIEDRPQQQAVICSTYPVLKQIIDMTGLFKESFVF